MTHCSICIYVRARVSQVFLNTRRGVGSWVSFSMFMVSACFWRGRLCFGRGGDRGFILYISLFLRMLGWGVCVCLYTRVHTHKLLGYLMYIYVCMHIHLYTRACGCTYALV